MGFSNLFWIVLGIQQGYLGGDAADQQHIRPYGATGAGEKTANLTSCF